MNSELPLHESTKYPAGLARAKILIVDEDVQSSKELAAVLRVALLDVDERPNIEGQRQRKEEDESFRHQALSAFGVA